MRSRVCLLIVLLSACVALGAPTTQKMPDPIPADNGMVVVQIPVDNMPIDAAVAQAKLLASPDAVVIGDERLHRLVVKDFPENVRKIQAHLKSSNVALPMVRLEVGFDSAAANRASGGGVTVGAAGTSRRVVVAGSANAYDNRSSVKNGGSMSVVAMSGSEGVINVGEFVPGAYYSDAAHALGLLAPDIVLDNVSTGFGMVPTVVGADEVVLRVYPRIAYTNLHGPGVVRFFDAATEVRVRSGQTVQIAAGSNDRQGLYGHILGGGQASSSQSGSFTVTATVMRDPYAR